MTARPKPRAPNAWVVHLKPGRDRTEEGIRRRKIFIHWERLGAPLAAPGMTTSKLRRLIEARYGKNRHLLGQFSHFILRMAEGDQVFVPCGKGKDQYVEGAILPGPARYDSDLGHYRRVRWLHGGQKLARTRLSAAMRQKMKVGAACVNCAQAANLPAAKGSQKRGGPPAARANRHRAGAGQGLGNDAERNRAVERRAVAVAKAYYRKRFEHVQEKGKPYDLRCRRNGGPPIYVEVKGSQGAGGKILLTIGEVNHFRRNAPRTELFVVSGIKVQGQPPKASGGRHQRFCRWQPAPEDLEPTQFNYAVPANPSPR